MEHKEDLAAGTAAAVAGGVTTVFEMPNTKPGTTTAAALADKLARAAGRAWCDHAFFIGAAADNAGRLAALERLPGCCGVKIFMGSSTGDLLVADDTTLAAVLAAGTRRVAVHAEDEARLVARRAAIPAGAGVEHHPVWRDEETAIRATERLLRLARRAGRPVHVLHVTTAAEMALLAEHKDIATVEVTPQHLTLAAPDCYARLGTRAQMNPPIRDAGQRDGLWRAVRSGVVDVVGSDHAPHTLAEKAGDYPATPSGMPGVQTLVPLLLDHVNAGRLTLERCRRPDGPRAGADLWRCRQGAPRRRLRRRSDARRFGRPADDHRRLDPQPLWLDPVRRHDGHRLADGDHRARPCRHARGRADRRRRQAGPCASRNACRRGGRKR